ncbi:MAG: protein kinase family protein, partial [Verrucomicrobiae bacterium]|nr:protein kinase family protein [Verrucomicrobiae bacterium]
MIRRCPRCQTNRSLEELLCQGRFGEGECGWPLFDILPSHPAEGGVASTANQKGAGGVAESDTPRLCRNGHPLALGDFLCLECGEPDIVEGASQRAESGAMPVVVRGWTLGEDLPVQSGESDLRLAEKDGITGVFKHYRRGIEPEVTLYPSLRSLDADHSIGLLDFGRHDDRAFEVWEYLPLGTLGAIPADEKSCPEFARDTLHELGQALHGLSQINLIHRDLKPANVLVRTREPLDLVLADFSTATVSEFDLQLTYSRQT